MKCGPEELLPSPAAARCQLAHDVLLNSHVMHELRGVADPKADQALARSVIATRDALLIERLTRVLPLEHLVPAEGEGTINLADLSERLPFVYAIWVATTAGELARHEKGLSVAVKKRLKSEGGGQEAESKDS